MISLRTYLLKSQHNTHRGHSLSILQQGGSILRLVCCSCGLGWSGNGKRQCGDLVGRKLAQVLVHDLVVREHAGVRRADHHGGQVFHGHAATKLAEDAPGVAEGPLARGLRAETRKLTARERGESGKLRDNARRGPKGDGVRTPSGRG